MLTGEQLRAGRAMVGWDQSELAEKANVSLKTIKRMEATSGQIKARSTSTWSVKNALEIAGIEFLDGGGDWRSRGDGVRFSKDRTAKVRRAVIEAMTGPLDADLQTLAEEDDDFFERPIGEVVEKIMSKMRENLTDELQRILRRDS
jgi:DNA-binding XRE family transcriptional regulator